MNDPLKQLYFINARSKKEAMDKVVRLPFASYKARKISKTLFEVTATLQESFIEIRCFGEGWRYAVVRDCEHSLVDRPASEFIYGPFPDMGIAEMHAGAEFPGIDEYIVWTKP